MKRVVRLKQTKAVGMVAVVKEAAEAMLFCLQVASSEVGKKDMVKLPFPCLLRVGKECQRYNVRLERKKEIIPSKGFLLFRIGTEKPRGQKQEMFE